MTTFFVPGAAPGEDEVRYAELAERVAAEVAPADDRILSVRFVRGAETWTATVGETLSGELAARTTRRTARGSAPTRRVTDPARVHAIYRAGDAYLVVTDGRPIGAVGDSTMANPVTVPVRDARWVDRFEV